MKKTAFFFCLLLVLALFFCSGCRIPGAVISGNPAEGNATNNAPILKEDIPNQTIKMNATGIMDLADYFMDPDNDSLDFNASETENMSIIIEDALAAIIPDIDFVGSETVRFYAGDGNAIAESNEVTIFVVNESEKNELNESNPANATLDCSGGCLYITDSGKTNIAAFDKQGNLAIKGGFAREISAPDENDFIIQDSNKTVVAWIDDATGNLRILGSKTEQTQTSCEAPENSFVIKDSEGSCVSYIDLAGNLWLRGFLMQNASI
jgi:hypothetical protein